MSTKFVSKNSNYMVVLKTGVEGNRALGTHSVPGLYVKFQAGIVDVKEDSITKLLREHPSFGTDFIEIKQDEVDPFKEERAEMEPLHTTSDIKYGHTENTKGATQPIKITAQMKKIIEKEALKMIPNILKKNPELFKETLTKMAKEMKESKEPGIIPGIVKIKENTEKEAGEGKATQEK